MSLAVSACNVPRLAQVLAQTASSLGNAPAAQLIGQVSQALVEGADVTLQISQAAADLQSQRWSAAGTDLITLSNYLSSTVCHTVPCQVVEGLLLAAGTALQDLQQCKADLQSSEGAFVAGAQALAQAQYGAAVNSWAAALLDASHAVSGTCGTCELYFIMKM